MWLKFVFPFSLLLLVGGVHPFDTKLDTHKDATRRWKIHGTYKYANSSLSNEVQEVRPGGAAGPVVGELEREGIWLIKHDPNGPNRWNMSYSLTHLLFSQAWVTLLAHPNVGVVFKSNKGEVAKFWSDGRGWCDAVFDLGLSNTFVAEVETQKEGDYVLIDKVVLGIMGNITALKGKKIENPCLTSPLTDDTPPDMEEKDEDNEVRKSTTEATPPDMVEKSKNGLPASASTLGVVTDSQSTTTTPPPAPNTSRRTYRTERGGAKCDCVCTCTKPNATISTSTTTPTASSSTTKGPF